MYNTTCPHLLLKIFVDFLTSTLLRAQNTTLLSKVRRRFFFQILWPSQKIQTLLKMDGRNYFTKLGARTMEFNSQLNKHFCIELLFRKTYIPFNWFTTYLLTPIVKNQDYNAFFVHKENAGCIWLLADSGLQTFEASSNYFVTIIRDLLSV